MYVGYWWSIYKLCHGVKEWLVYRGLWWLVSKLCRHDVQKCVVSIRGCWTVSKLCHGGMECVVYTG